MFVAGIFDEWLNKLTGELVRSMSIVTTKGNQQMATIHNNPKLEEPRMPLILNDKLARTWLEEPDVALSYFNKDEIHLNTRTVRRLRGKQYVGNTEEAWEKHAYSELNEQQELF
jgi:putative SOS response-associated peptidase YedK